MAPAPPPPAPPPAVTVLNGLDRINEALDVAAAECRTEVLTVQPGGARPEYLLVQALERTRLFADREIKMRTLYQHTVRHSYGVYAYAEQLAELCEIRTLEDRVERLMVFDGTTAFVPAPTAPDDPAALRLQEPRLVQYLSTVFEHFWQQAVPLHEPLPEPPAPDGITGIRRSIARLLVEGHVDEEIAHRLGLHVRTCRAHIAKLSAALGGSSNRAQLGYQIARSGILDRPEAML